VLLNKQTHGWLEGGRLLRYDTQTKSETFFLPVPFSSRSLVLVKQILYEFCDSVVVLSGSLSLDIANKVEEN